VIVTYVVVPSVWRPAKRVFTRGDRLSEAEIEALGPVDSFRRLGLIAPIADPLSELTKKELLVKADELGLDVDGRLGKPKILTAVKEALDGV